MSERDTGCPAWEGTIRGIPSLADLARLWHVDNGKSTAERAVCMSSYVYGLRSQEAVQLRWQDVDLSGALVRVARVKAGRVFTRPIPDELGELLAELHSGRHVQRDGGLYVWPGRKGMRTRQSISAIIRRVARSVDCPLPQGKSPLRHVCAIRLWAAGTTPQGLMVALGLRTLQATNAYIAELEGMLAGELPPLAPR